MNLNNKLNSVNKKKIVVLISLIVVLIIAICIVIFLPKSPEEVEVKPPAPTLEIDTPEIVTPEPEISQEEILGVMTGLITNVKDLSTKYEYTVLIGKDDSTTETIVTANLNTLFYNFDTSNLALASDIKIGDKVVIYGKGNYTVGNVVADVLVIGENTSYRYGEISKIDGNVEDGYSWNLNFTFDKLNVTSASNVINGYTGFEIKNMGLILKGSKVLYKYAPEFDITENGNIYHCTDIIVLSLGEKDEENK